MNVHFEKKIVFMHHQCVGSTATVPPLKARGFENLGGHHDGPWSLRPHRDQNYYGWWKSDPRKYTYCCTVRNPFSVILSHWWQYGEPDGGRGPVTVEFLEDFLVRGIKYFPNRGKLFRFAWEGTPGPLLVLHAEDLQSHLNLLFDEFALPLLQANEMERKNVTPGKPAVNLGGHFTEEALAWIEKYHAEELKRFVYSLEDLP